MKFTLLPIGARFRYQGEVFSKTGPLAASSGSGARRMIPRSAVVEPLQDDGTTPRRVSPQRQALDQYHAAAQRLLADATAAGPDRLAELTAALDSAHRHACASFDDNP